MAFGMFSAAGSPIAIDFGSSSVKLLQIGHEAKPSLLAAAEISVPPTIGPGTPEAMDLLAQQLPQALRDGRFKGRRAVCSVPCGLTHIQHMQLPAGEGLDREQHVKAQLQAQFGWPPAGVEVRAVDVVDRPMDGQNRVETIAFAVTRDAVMRHVDLLRKCRLEVVGVHTEVVAMVRAFDHLNRRAGDELVTTLYVDLGYGGTKVAIRHGTRLVFAKCIGLGGRYLDQLTAATLHCDMVSARAHRLSQPAALQVPAPARAAQVVSPAGFAAMMSVAAGAAPGQERADGALALAEDRRTGLRPAELGHDVPPTAAVKPPHNVDFTESLDALADELAMCVRYHHALFPGRPIDRVIFLGGESRQLGLCRHIAQTLRVPAQVGDPMARLTGIGQTSTPGLTLGRPQPGWAVPYGLCTAPTDL